MKTITITVSVDGNEVTREYMFDAYDTSNSQAWGKRVVDMFETIEKSTEPMGDMKGFEGTTEALNKLSI